MINRFVLLAVSLHNVPLMSQSDFGLAREFKAAVLTHPFQTNQWNTRRKNNWTFYIHKRPKTNHSP